jgi:DNA-binding NtrC family response regulator
MNTVLCVDDKEEELQALRYLLADQYRVLTCRDAPKAASMVARNQPSIVLLDVDMPGKDGFRVLSEIRELANPPPVVMLSAHPDPFFVVRAIKGGAADYYSKPFSGAMLRHRLATIIPPRHPSTGLPGSTKTDAALKLLAGSSPAIAETRAILAAYAKSDAPVLILGESGTGKDRAARLLHALSARAAGPFEVRNMAALPATIAESELFGCERGAFTDARERSGCFEAAHGGTLFLDEIAEAGPELQAALLRVVEDRLVRKLGSNKHVKADCRLVFATNRDLEEEALRKTFRRDLLFRISTLPVILPPLRERPGDIPELVGIFLADNRRAPDDIEPEALDRLMKQAWPGNVRQLKACIDRASVLSGGEAGKKIGLRNLIL